VIRLRHHALLAAITLLSGTAVAIDPRFGDLPDGSLSTSEMGGVSAEICRDHLFDPQAANVALPAGYRLISAAEAANADPSLAALLRRNPRQSGYALGSLCFLSVASFVVDNTAVHSVNPMPIAFWWASAEGPRHASMRGRAGWVQLGSWYPSNAHHRSVILKTDPMARFVDLDVQQTAPNTWNVRLVLAHETVVAEVQSSGQPARSKAAESGYMTVPMSGESADYFSVFTYFGHIHRPAKGTWKATGTGVFSDALAVPDESSVFKTVFQQGWSSKSGLYQFSTRQRP
jgi:hypothetical protein